MYGYLAKSLLLLCSGKVWWRKVWRIDSVGVFGERKFGELIDQPIDSLL